MGWLLLLFLVLTCLALVALISTNEPAWFLLLLPAIIGGVITGHVCKAQRRAEHFNKVTGSNVTWRDACWLELRVSKEPKEAK